MKTSAGSAVVFFVAVLSIFGVSSAVFAQTNCIAEIPDVIISPSNLVSPPGETAVFTVDVENEDSDNCDIKQFAMSGTSEGGFSVSFSPSTLFIAPGDSETTLMKVSITSGAVAKTYQIKAFANSGSFQGADDATLEVREQVEECEVAASNLRFKEKNSDKFEDEFSNDDEVSVLVDVSLLGNAVSQVTLDLFVEGSVLDSETDNYPGNSDTTFKFGNKILTKNYNDDIDVRVVATAACNPTETDEDEGTIEIIESEDDIDLDIRVGTPANTIVGKEVVARVFVENDGSEDVDVNLDGFLCSSGLGCKEMDCGDSTILVEEDETMELVCRYTPTQPGEYRVRADVTFSDDEDIERSNEFFVYSTQQEVAQSSGAAVVPTVAEEEAEKVKEIRYTCSGNLRQAIFSTTVGVKISDIEFCPNGCRDGRCTQLATPVRKAATPAVSPISGEGEQPKPVFSKPQFTPPVLDLDNFLDWLKNLWFSVTS